MDQLISRNYRDMRHYNEDDWTMVGWQDRRVLDDAAAPGKNTAGQTVGDAGSLVGVVYAGAFILFVLVFLT